MCDGATRKNAGNMLRFYVSPQQGNVDLIRNWVSKFDPNCCIVVHAQKINEILTLLLLACTEK